MLLMLMDLASGPAGSDSGTAGPSAGLRTLGLTGVGLSVLFAVILAF